MTGRPWKQYTSHDIHRRLIDQCLSERWHESIRDDTEIGSQALHCTYYVPLEGALGSDWGVIVNPESSRFGLLTFEHDDCGCPVEAGEDDVGWGRHYGAPDQVVDAWKVGWEHVCDGWCERPCVWATPTVPLG